jgi:hypothetical protein
VSAHSTRRLGEVEQDIDRAKSVYLNCPFDAEYSSLLDAIVFSCVCCGFFPRCAVETGTVAEPRILRIIQTIFDCRYSIHDLSRCTGEGDENLARFNMPLELGIAMARRFIGPAHDHDWLALVPRGKAYARFISDLAAYDPAEHDGSIESVVPAVMYWLATRKDAVGLPYPDAVLLKLPEFRNAKAELEVRWRGHPPWPQVILAAARIARTLD